MKVKMYNINLSYWVFEFEILEVRDEGCNWTRFQQVGYWDIYLMLL